MADKVHNDCLKSLVRLPDLVVKDSKLERLLLNENQNETESGKAKLNLNLSRIDSDSFHAEGLRYPPNPFPKPLLILIDGLESNLEWLVS